MAEDMGDKTELPTQRKLDDARQKGNVARSQDLVGAIDLVGAMVLLVNLGDGIVRTFRNVLVRSVEGGAEALDISTIGPLLRSIALELIVSVAPVLGGMFVIGILANVLQTGMLFTTETLTPKLERLNPIEGIKRLMGVRGTAKSLVSMLKLTAVLLTAYWYLGEAGPRLANLPALNARGALSETGAMLVELSTRLLVLMVAIGIIDYVYQRWQYTRDLKMTKEEIKEERRNMDGDPHVRSRRQRMMRELALQRINSAVPQANVIVTNPTHYSVAIQYDPATMAAPRVVAKGVDHLAMRIRQVAAANQVPIVERPPLARALYANVEVGHEIAPEFYEAVAELLAYVYRLEASAA
ncbi:MAG: flagellar biosynthesis protein FlhB [Phycisphaerales bacterium]|jgi:flagellar biosynthetic protein FlhB